MSQPVYSLIVPVYRNEGSIPEMLDAIEWMAGALDAPLEAVFVVDSSPDRCYEMLELQLPHRPFASQLLLHSRNFGSFAGIRTGLEHARGEFFATMAADLQEPPALAVELFQTVAKQGSDIAVGTRASRGDGIVARKASGLFWRLYRRFVQREVPEGGADMFACNRAVRDVVVGMREANSSLVGLLFWAGFRRTNISYERQERRHGKSAWTFDRKLRYVADSVFSFSDLPVRLLWLAGLGGMLAAAVMTVILLVGRFTGHVGVPGYTATILTIVFFAAVNCLGLGIIGSYVWRAFENTKGRPLAIVMDKHTYDPDPQ